MKGTLSHVISLGLFCLGLWLLLSGFFDNTLLLSLGVFSCALVTWVAWRVEMIDPEEQPPHLRFNPQILLYWPWLLKQVVLSNIDVTRRILDPKLPISPTLIELKPSQHSDLGRVIYANSITLTPGTVTVALSGDSLTVHALTRSGAEDLQKGDMDRWVAVLEKEST